MQKYLETSQYIDWHHPVVLEQAKLLAGEEIDKEQISKAFSRFKFVRDEIKHSFDYELNPVTCKASDVLKQGTG